MMASDNIIDVSEADFEYHVLAFSEEVPVVVDFWAAWCIPCRTLGPLLERMALEADGAFRLAKVDVDKNPNLARRYSVQSIPSVKAFHHGKVVSEFTGSQPEPKVREFLQSIAPDPTDLLIERGKSMLEVEDWQEAEIAFSEALDIRPKQPAAILGLAKSLIAQGRIKESEQFLNNFPASREYAAAETLRYLVVVLGRIQNGFGTSNDLIEAMYHNSLRLVLKGNIQSALDGLLDVLREDKHYRDGEVRQVILGLFEILGDSDLTRQYRQELASVIF